MRYGGEEGGEGGVQGVIWCGRAAMGLEGRDVTKRDEAWRSVTLECMLWGHTFGLKP